MCTCAKNTLIHFNFYSYNIFCVLLSVNVSLLLVSSSQSNKAVLTRQIFMNFFCCCIFTSQISFTRHVCVLDAFTMSAMNRLRLDFVGGGKKKRAHTYYSKCRSFFSLVFDWFTRPDCKESAFYWLQFMLCIDSNKIKSLSPMCVQCQCTVQPLYSHCNRTMRKCLTEMLNKYQDRARTLARSFARLSALYEITHN